MTVDMVPRGKHRKYGVFPYRLLRTSHKASSFTHQKKKLGAKTAPFFIGCGVFFIDGC